MEEVKFPLSEEEQDKYYDHTEIDRANGTTFEVYKINDKYYDMTGEELTESKLVEGTDGSDSIPAIKAIKDKFNSLIEEKGLAKEDLYEDGQIYIDNSNMGIDGDWIDNKHTSYFYVYYKNTGLGFAKMAIDEDGKLYGCYYPDEGNGKPEVFEEGVVIDTESLDDLIALLYSQLDETGKYKVPISEINWNAYADDTDYPWIVSKKYDYEDDEDYDDYEDGKYEYDDEEDEEY